MELNKFRVLNNDNQLTGNIRDLTSLTDLELANNQLIGEIPIELWEEKFQ